MNERIKELRKSLGLTLEKFGECIGIKKSSLSTIENGKSNASEQTILFICREFNVNEDWLRTGEGEMFKTIDSEVSTCIKELLSEENPLFDVIKSIMITYKKLDADSRDIVDGFISKSVEELKSTTLNNNVNNYDNISDTYKELKKEYSSVENSHEDKNIS